MYRKEKDMVKKIILFALPFVGLLVLLIIQYVKGRIDVDNHREQLRQEQQIEHKKE